MYKNRWHPVLRAKLVTTGLYQSLGTASKFSTLLRRIAHMSYMQEVLSLQR